MHLPRKKVLNGKKGSKASGMATRMVWYKFLTKIDITKLTLNFLCYVNKWFITYYNIVVSRYKFPPVGTHTWRLGINRY